jgi:hypothetical protein
MEWGNHGKPRRKEEVLWGRLKEREKDGRESGIDTKRRKRLMVR